MQEKRRSKRLPVRLELHVSKLFRQEEMKEIPTAVPITVTDVSKLGLGFVTAGELPVGYYFNAKLELGSSENSLYCVVQIIRKQPLDDGAFSYGCEFVGMSPMLGYVFEEYEKLEQKEEARDSSVKG